MEVLVLEAWIQDIVARLGLGDGALDVELGVELEGVIGVEVELRGQSVWWGLVEDVVILKSMRVVMVQRPFHFESWYTKRAFDLSPLQRSCQKSGEHMREKIV